MHEMHILCTWPCISLPAEGLSRALRCGARRGAACAPRRKCGSRPGSVASRELASNHGIASRLAEPRRTMETPQFKILLCCLLLQYHACITPSLKFSLKRRSATEITLLG